MVRRVPRLLVLAASVATTGPGYARDQARAARAGTDPKVPIDRFRDLYPLTADSLGKCLAVEKRA